MRLSRTDLSGRTPMRRTLCVWAIALTASACAGAGQRVAQDPFVGGGGTPTAVRIHVDNRNFSDARLYAVTDGGQRRLIGIVNGKREAAYTLPWTFPRDLRIEIDLLAGRTCSTAALMVDPGDVLELQILSDFSASSFCR